MEDQKSKCFVCQSESQSGSDESSTNDKNVDLSTWKIFCHYFYPPPLIILFDSTSSSNSPESNQNEEQFSSPVFCELCCKTILKLCGFHKQLESMQRKISKLVAKVSLNFVQEENEENEGDNNSNHNVLSTIQRQSKKRKRKECEDDRVYFMRRCIRQRYQPFVCIKRSNIDIPKEIGGGSRNNNNLQVAEASPLYSDSDVDLCKSPKQEVDDSFDQVVNDTELNNTEQFNEHENISKNLKKKVTKKLLQSQRKVPVKKKIKDKSSDDKNQDKDKNNPTTKIIVVGGKPDEGIKKVEGNIYEYEDKWRIERKREQGKKDSRLHCLTCSKSFAQFSYVINHIRREHIKDPLLIRKSIRQTEKIDDNTFIYQGTCTIQKVQEPNGIFYKCGTCSILLNTFDTMRAHVKRYHIEGKKWVCEQCGYNAVRRDYLISHMNKHALVREYICEKCGKSYKSNDALLKHMETHVGKSYPCECGAKYSQYRNLLNHRKKFNHVAPNKVGPTPENPFVSQRCPTCKKEFVSPERLRKHVCKKLERKPCDWCLTYSADSFTRINEHKLKNCPERFKFNKLDSVDGADGNVIPFDLEDTPDV